MRRTPLGLVMLCVLSAAGVCSSTSAPESPRQFDCRSREKETFSCWWEPGSDGGLPTQYRLFYEIENSRGVQECPDYVSAGENSCFFDKKHTSIWAEYIMTVVATNALGNASAQFEIPDVMKYLKPDPPVNVTVVVNTSAPSSFLEIRWKSPPNVDFKTGWVTPKYELRVKQNDSKEWKTVDIGAQAFFNFHNVEPGLLYMIQVRCNLDHGKWSEWSDTIFAKIPKHRELEKYFWIFVFVFSLIPLLTAIYILVLKRKVVKQYLLPPVPGPKIKGVNVHLLKSGQTEDVVNALTGNQNFPPTVAWMEEAEDFLLVSDNDEWLLTNPFASEKKNDIFIIPAGLHLGLEIQHGDSTVDLNTWEKTDDGKQETKSDFLNTEPINLPVEKQECLNGEEVSIQPLANTSYVDIQQRPTLTDYSRVKEVNGDTILILNEEEIPHCSDAVEVKSEMSVPDNYSRVKEVYSDVVFLEKGDSTEEYCKKKEDHFTDWTNQKPTMPHESELSKGFSSKMIANGYIDSVPTFPVK